MDLKKERFENWASDFLVLLFGFELQFDGEESKEF